jgi:AhpD family alkylhydroperoxidase
VTMATVEARMKHPIMMLPDAYQAMLTIHKAASAGGVPEVTLYLVHLRASQINGCSWCSEAHSRELKEAGESDERIYTVAAWREAPYFTDAERVALEVTEALTRLADRPDPISDELWYQLREHYDERAIAELLIEIGLINVWNRINAAIRQPADAYRR